MKFAIGEVKPPSAIFRACMPLETEEWPRHREQGRVRSWFGGRRVSRNSGDLVEIGSRVKTLRGEKRWTQEKLAQEAGISKSFVSEVESGQSKPRGPILVKLARALGASLDFLLTGSSPPAPRVDNIEIPTELVAIAERRNIPFQHVRLLMDFVAAIEARRRDVPHRLSESDWERFYDDVLPHLPKALRGDDR